MEKFGKSQSIRRLEDVRFLKGQGRFVDDIAPEGALVAYFLRSPVAHAEIRQLDLEGARALPGVHLVLSSQDLLNAGVRLPMRGVLVKNRDGSDGAAPERPLLAHGRVRFVGEAVAMIVADTIDIAKDAAEVIEFEYQELPVNLALNQDGPGIHPEAPNNMAFDWGFGDEEATETVFFNAARVVSLEIENNRVIVASMEPRGCYAETDEGRLHLSLTGQGVWVHRDQLCSHLGLVKDDVRVTIPDVGGGFGMKAMAYPEYFVVAQAARMLNRPVRWMSERGEAMLSDHGARDLTHTAELAFDADHRILAYRVKTRTNLGAYNSQFGQAIQTNLFKCVLPGVYDLQTTWLHVEGYYTNTTQVDAYRGAGRPEAIYLLERLIDRSARELGVDPWELRRKNFIPANAFPYKSATGETYDVGDFHRVLAKAEENCDRAGFPSRRAASEAKGKLRGLGLCYYIESILGDPSEGAKVEFNEDGTVTIYVGTQSNGQGHETVYAQFLSDQTGIPTDMIEVVQGDTDRIKAGGGTGGSRSVTVQANATLAVVDKMTVAFRPFLAAKMVVEEGKIMFDDDRFRAEGSNLAPTLQEAAGMARAEGRSDLLMFEARSTLPARSFPNGAHVAEVEIDPDTGSVSVERYCVVDDFGNLINPLLAEGQVHGGIVQGIGQAQYEHVIHDEDGQLLTASLMDYALPRASQMPMFDFDTEPVPSTTNPMGMKGCGEAGTVGALAAFSNAVQDALWEKGVRRADMPFTPNRVWDMLQNGSDKAQ